MIPQRHRGIPSSGWIRQSLPARTAHLTATGGSAEAGGNRQPSRPGHRRGQLLGGIEAAPAPAPRPRRDGHDVRCSLSPRQGSQHGVCRHARQREPAAVLEAQDHPPPDSLEGRHRDREVDPPGPGLDHGRCGGQFALAALAEDAIGIASLATGGAKRRVQRRAEEADRSRGAYATGNRIRLGRGREV